MQVYRGMDIGTAKPSAVERADVPHHLIDVLDPWEDFTVAALPGRRRDGAAPTSRRAGTGAVLVGGTGLYVQAVVDDLDVPGRWPDVRAELEADPDTGGAAPPRLAELDPAAAGAWSPATAAGSCGRSRSPPAAAGRSRRSDRDSTPAPARPLPRWSAWRWLAAGARPSGSPPATTRMMEAGLVDEVARPRRRPGGLSRTAGQALGYKELLDHLRRRAEPRRGRRPRPCAAPAASPGASARWFRRDPRVRWVDVGDDPVAEVLAALGGPPDR